MVLLKRVDENWYYACTLDQTRIGFIPANFLDVRIDLSEQKEVAPSVTAPRVIQPSMEESPYKKITDISPIPDGALLLVNQEFIGENSGDLSASVQDVLLWLEPGAKRGDAPPEEWIKCSKLNGISGDFPGNVVQPLSDEGTILMYLRGIPQAEATRDYEGVPGQCIPLKKGEVLYLSKEDASFCYGRSASGKEGKVPKDVCRVTVPLQ
ncbi:unnamed protein product [Dibothriocephalus latus]|uniref:SH3 domain-containing protein n=1 Tax=Dibothriocephalus latus TaxID=60516 RepID=A0A3P7L6T0_DIBLA|nr:unnamed protein product [Dibothriocephalus latus]